MRSCFAAFAAGAAFVEAAEGSADAGAECDAAEVDGLAAEELGGGVADAAGESAAEHAAADGAEQSDGFAGDESADGASGCAEGALECALAEGCEAVAEAVDFAFGGAFGEVDDGGGADHAGDGAGSRGGGGAGYAGDDAGADGGDVDEEVFVFDDPGFGGFVGVFDLVDGGDDDAGGLGDDLLAGRDGVFDGLVDFLFDFVYLFGDFLFGVVDEFFGGVGDFLSGLVDESFGLFGFFLGPAFRVGRCGGDTYTVAAVTSYTGARNMYNLTIAEPHTLTSTTSRPAET